ncbi:acyltransferase family protein [Pseudomonadota bacterium]
MLYRPQLDALRALAVFAVLIHHFAPTLGSYINVSLGYQGVRLFFVLSGYLITTILINESKAIKDNEKSLGNALFVFYSRRLLRLGPAYCGVLGVSFFLLNPDVRSGIFYYLTYTQNFLFAIQGWFPGTTAHLWSLAVEEQFYLLWPIVVFLTPIRHVYICCIAMILISSIYKYLGYRYGMSLFESGLDLYVMPMAHFDSLGVGALLACMNTTMKIKNIRLYLQLMSTTALVVVFIAFITLPATEIKPDMLDLSWALVFGYIVYECDVGVRGRLGKVLEVRPLVWLGKISYGIYLYHLFVAYALAPLLSSAQLGEFTSFLILTTMTVLVSTVSWYLIEKPANTLKKHFPYS